MGKKKSKHCSKKNKSKKNRADNKNNVESNLSKEQKQQKTSYDEIAEIFLGTNPDKNIESNTNLDKEISGTSADKKESQTNTDESKSENYTTNSDSSNECSDKIKAQQQELINNLKNLNDTIAAITLTRDNIASLRIEVLSNIYFTREVRPLIDAANLIAFASSNMTNAANNISNNVFGDKKEIKNAFKLSYKMNDEINDLLGALSRRIKLYVEQLDEMDRNCSPFDFKEDS